MGNAAAGNDKKHCCSGRCIEAGDLGHGRPSKEEVVEILRNTAPEDNSAQDDEHYPRSWLTCVRAAQPWTPPSPQSLASPRRLSRNKTLLTERNGKPCPCPGYGLCQDGTCTECMGSSLLQAAPVSPSWARPVGLEALEDTIVRRAGRIYKPLRSSERAFYERLVIVGEEPDMRKFVPVFHGTRKAVEIQAPPRGDPARKYLDLGDVTFGMGRPLTADVRMGTHGPWLIDHELSKEQREECWRKGLQSPSGSLGWEIDNLSTDERSIQTASSLLDCDLGIGTTKSDSQSIRRVVHFVASAGPEFADRVALAFVRQLAAILQFFTSPARRTQFFGSSLLFAYDLSCEDWDCKAIVRMISFANTVSLRTPSVDDSGYVCGLISLIAIFAQLACMGGNFAREVVARRSLVPMDDRKPRAGALIYAMVQQRFCLLLITTANAKEWIFPKGKLEKNETVQAAGMREAKEEAGADTLEVKRILEPRVMVRNGKEGASLRMFSLILAEAVGSPLLAPSPLKAPETPALAPETAVESSVWVDGESGLPKVRAWVPLEHVGGVLTRQWTWCTLQSTWEDLLKAKEGTLSQVFVQDSAHPRISRLESNTSNMELAEI